jgi:hypothetical protein
LKRRASELEILQRLEGSAKPALAVLAVRRPEVAAHNRVAKILRGVQERSEVSDQPCVNRRPLNSFR